MHAEREARRAFDAPGLQPKLTFDPAEGQAPAAIGAARPRVAILREQGVPAYIVFGDATLRALAEHRPRSVGDLDGITGIGAKKREAYGEAVVAVIAANA